jgi:hypothetical protein
MVSKSDFAIKAVILVIFYNFVQNLLSDNVIGIVSASCPA